MNNMRPKNKEYFLNKILFSLLFSLFATPIFANIQNLVPTEKIIPSPDDRLELIDILNDYLFIFFLFIGVIISITHEYLKKKRDYKVSLILLILSMSISIGFTVLIWVLYNYGVFPVKFYYAIVLFTASFSPGIVRYLLSTLPEKFGNLVYKTADKVVDIATTTDNNNNANNTENY